MKRRGGPPPPFARVPRDLVGVAAVGEAEDAVGVNRFATGLRALTPPARWALVALTLAGALLRIAYQAGRTFVGDEAGSLIVLSRSYGELLTTFHDPWLSMNVYLAMLKALSGAPLLRDWVMVAPSLVAGVAMIPLTAALALRLASPRTALVAAALVAANPYLLFYSVQLRSYILLAAFALASLLFFVDWRRSPSRRNAWSCSVCGTLAVLMHANGIYFGLFLAALAALWLFEEGWPSRERLRRASGLALPVLAGAGVAALAYAPVAAEMARYRAKWSSVPPSSLAYLPDVYARYFGEGWLGLPTLACLLAGLWAAAQRNRALAAMALGFAVPITAISWAGISQLPWVHARYLIASLPILVLFVAAGVSWWTGRRGALACALLTAVVVASWTPEIRTLFAEKERYPWRTAATYLNHNLREGDGRRRHDGRRPAASLRDAVAPGRAIGRLPRRAHVPRPARRPSGTAGRREPPDAHRVRRGAGPSRGDPDPRLRPGDACRRRARAPRRSRAERRRPRDGRPHGPLQDGPRPARDAVT